MGRSREVDRREAIARALVRGVGAVLVATAIPGILALVAGGEPLVGAGASGATLAMGLALLLTRPRAWIAAMVGLVIVSAMLFARASATGATWAYVLVALDVTAIAALIWAGRQIPETSASPPQTT